MHLVFLGREMGYTFRLELHVLVAWHRSEPSCTHIPTNAKFGHSFLNVSCLSLSQKYMCMCTCMCISIVHCCLQVFVSEEYKFVYIRQPKSSSSSTLAAIRELYCSGRECKQREFMKVADAKSLSKKMWKTFFVFTIVRNPVTRMVSAYLMFTRRFLHIRDPHNLKKKGPQCTLPFPEFATDVYALARICSTRQCCAYIKGTKNAFVTRFPNAHVTQQAHSVFTTDGRLIVDYIGRTENISDDWMEITKLIAENSGMNVGSVPMVHMNTRSTPDDAPEETQHACLSEDIVSLGIVNQTTVREITLQFAMDMELLQFT